MFPGLCFCRFCCFYSIKLLLEMIKERIAPYFFLVSRQRELTFFFIKLCKMNHFRESLRNVTAQLTTPRKPYWGSCLHNSSNYLHNLATQER